MSCSPAFKWFIAVLFPLTFASKLAIVPAPAIEPADRIAAFLRRHNFEAVAIDPVVHDRVVVRAVKEACRVLVAQIDGAGWTREFFATLAERNDRIFFVVGGATYEQNPRWLTTTYLLFNLIARRFQFMRPGLVLIVAVAPSCEAEQLPWNTL